MTLTFTLYGPADTDGAQVAAIIGPPGEATAFSVHRFGATGDGVTDDRSSIQAAIDFVEALGGGVVAFGAGIYRVTSGVGSVAVALKTNVNLRGVGSASIIKLANGADAHVINIADVENCGLHDLAIDGNRANQTASVHGIRVAGVEGLTIENVAVRSTYHYGIGIQDGTNKWVKIDKVFVTDTGGDGIDIKNKNDDNEDFQLTNITVTSWGNDASQTIQAAIDCRGLVLASNIWISDPVASDAVGYRFRPGELLDANGYGAHRSSLSAFNIRMGGGATQVGLSVVARDVSVGQGCISGGFRGVMAQDSGFRATGVTVSGASGDGWLLDAAGGGLDADDAILTGCQALSNGSDGFDIETSAQLLGCVANGNTAFGANVRATSADTRCIGGDYSGNTSGAITDAGTATLVRNAIGYVTESQVESGSLTLDSTGSKTAVIAHGLAKTPSLKQCIPHLIRETAVTDPVIVNLWVEGADATNVTVRARVTTASATGGATFRIGVNIRV